METAHDKLTTKLSGPQRYWMLWLLKMTEWVEARLRAGDIDTAHRHGWARGGVQYTRDWNSPPFKIINYQFIGGKISLRWQPSKWANNPADPEDYSPWTRSDAASMSRTIRRLKDRGLIETENWVSDKHRTTLVCLTDAGREAAKRLT
jgi:hypothetical protein